MSKTHLLFIRGKLTWRSLCSLHRSRHWSGNPWPGHHTHRRLWARRLLSASHPRPRHLYFAAWALLGWSEIHRASRSFSLEGRLHDPGVIYFTLIHFICKWEVVGWGCGKWGSRGENRNSAEMKCTSLKSKQKICTTDDLPLSTVQKPCFNNIPNTRWGVLKAFNQYLYTSAKTSIKMAKWGKDAPSDPGISLKHSYSKQTDRFTE